MGIYMYVIRVQKNNFFNIQNYFKFALGKYWWNLLGYYPFFHIQFKKIPLLLLIISYPLNIYGWNFFLFLQILKSNSK